MSYIAFDFSSSIKVNEMPQNELMTRLRDDLAKIVGNNFVLTTHKTGSKLAITVRMDNFVGALTTSFEYSEIKELLASPSKWKSLVFLFAVYVKPSFAES